MKPLLNNFTIPVGAWISISVISSWMIIAFGMWPVLMAFTITGVWFGFMQNTQNVKSS